MIIVMRPKAPQEHIRNIVTLIENRGLQAHLSHGHEVTIIGVVGDKNKLHDYNIQLLPSVEKILAVSESYKLASKKFHPENSYIHVGNTIIGPDTLTIMAGPCAVESEEQMISIAREVKNLVLSLFVVVHTSHVLHHMHSRALKKKALSI